MVPSEVDNDAEDSESVSEAEEAEEMEEVEGGMVSAVSATFIGFTCACVRPFCGLLLELALVLLPMGRGG